MADKGAIVKNTAGARVNVATEETAAGLAGILGWLKRLVQAAGSLAVTDPSGRQRVIVDVSAAVTAGSYSTTYNTATPVTLPTPSVTITQVVHEPNMPVDQRFEFIDRARVSYAVGIREKLTFG